jgi:DNA-binding GntR family transcriptional regulator
LESESARLAARHATKDDLAKLRELCKVGTAYQEAGDIDATVRTNGELHSLITQMSGNRFLVDFAAQVDRRVRWYYTPVAPVRGAASWREHSRLVKAIGDSDEDKAAQIMREHTEHTRKAYHDLQSPEPAEAPSLDTTPRRRRRTTA